MAATAASKGTAVLVGTRKDLFVLPTTPGDKNGAPTAHRFWGPCGYFQWMAPAYDRAFRLRVSRLGAGSRRGSFVAVAGPGAAGRAGVLRCQTSGHVGRPAQVGWTLLGHAKGDNLHLTPAADKPYFFDSASGARVG